MDWMSEKATAAALRSKNDSLLAQRQRLTQELETLNDHELEITEIKREVDRLNASYKAYADRREESRIDQALEAEQISSISVVQPPTFSERPVTPKTMVVLAIGSFLAITGAFLLVIIADYFDDSFATPEQVERQLDLPVLVSIRRMSAARNIQAHWRSAP
jgi:uncharacterized protein involved in exopolysaccharide biosynthesis